MKLDTIDNGREFDFGKTSAAYVKYRDIYPSSMYEKLISYGIGMPGQQILDLGSGTAVLPLNLYRTGAVFTATDISENQIAYGKQLAEEQGLNRISFKICSAEETGFDDRQFDVVTAVQCFHYFNVDKAAAEIHRVLRQGGLFCKIFMEWLPYEDEVIAQMERLVLKYNPGWSGKGYRSFQYRYPQWARDRFTINTIHSYDVTLSFDKESWINRVLTCRGVGASLSPKEIAAFEAEYRKLLENQADTLCLKHQINIELYNKAN